MLYDGGRGDDAALIYFQSVGVKSLDLVVASHADADRIGVLEASSSYSLLWTKFWQRVNPKAGKQSQGCCAKN